MFRSSSSRALTLLVLVLAGACTTTGGDGATSIAEGEDGGPAGTTGGSGSSKEDAATPEAERCATPPCADGERCKEAADCTSRVCTDRVCIAASGADGVKNAAETDVDCGGPSSGAPRCADGKTCAAASDCTSLSCTSGACQPPTSTDGIKNGTETDVDCGGSAPTNAARCATSKACSQTSDCDAAACSGNVCQPPSSSDEIKNGTETDVDCGGGAPTNAARCATGKACSQTSDCNGVACSGNVCQPPTSSDEIKNGTETDVDCGGGAPTNAARCAVDKLCTTHADCASSACALSGPKAGRCVPFKSCVKNNGGFTCGRDDRDFGENTVALESCCDTAAIPASTVKVNRFAITAGRMRAFVERLNGNVRGWVQAPATKPAGWSSAWDVLVPSNVAEAEIMLGSYWANAPNDPNTTNEKPHSKRSCGNDNYNGHTYWVSSEGTGQIYSQDQLDPKVLNCVGWHLVRAFCAWDGGRLPTQAELRAVWTNGNTSTYPWGYAGSLYTAAYDSTVQDERLNHVFSYGFPGPTPASNRITWWLSPPGRFWRGWNANKVEIAGNVLEWTGDQEYNFAWNMSFENHTGTMNNGGDWRTPNDRTDVPNGYYALGARCAYP